MTRKVLIALAIVALSVGSVAQADEPWGYTTWMTYEWAVKKSYIDVYIKVVRWAQIYTKYAIVMSQQPDASFRGCTWVAVCCNFVNLQINAELIVDSTASGTPLADDWSIAIDWQNGHVGDGDLDTAHNTLSYPVTPTFVKVIDDDQPTGEVATLILPGPHLTGNLAYVSVCVMVEGVDPQAMQFLTPADPYGTPGANIQPVGTVVLTYFPHDPPTSCDWPQGIHSGPPVQVVGDTLWPGHDGPPPNGDGQVHNIPSSIPTP